MKTLRKRSFKTQLMTVVILASLVPLLILSVFSIVFITRSAENSMEARLSEVLKSTDELVSSTIKEQKSSLVLLGDEMIGILANNDSVPQDNKQLLEKMMYQYMLSSKSTLNMYFIDVDGSFIGTSDLPKNYQLPVHLNWGIFRAANHSDNAVMFENTAEPLSSNNNAYSIIYRMETSKAHFGYLILDVSTEHVQKIVNTVKGTSFGYVQFILTSKGDRVIYNDSSFRSPISYLQNILSFDQIESTSGTPSTLKLDQVILSSRSNDEMDLTFFGLVPKDMIDDQSTYILFGLIAFIVSTGIIAAISAYRATDRTTQPLMDLVFKMKNYKPNNEESPSSMMANEVDELDNQFNDLIRRVDDSIQSDIQKQELLRIAEIKSLMAQLNPHFLNNTLDSIKWKAKLYGAEDIATMVAELSVLLKISMNTEPFVTVGEELDFIDSYISIQRERYGDKLTYIREVKDETVNEWIPKLILQPIVENAIIHGVEPLNSEGVIKISSWIDSESLYLMVKDNGVGSNFDLANRSHSDHSSIGLANVDSRLKLHYGAKYGLKWKSNIGVGTEVLIEIPLVIRGDMND